MDIGDWLRRIGLERYDSLFRENEIDDQVLPEIRELDLERFGIPFGHRKLIMKAIRSETHSAVPDLLASAERRQLTVMFCDLVGSTALSATLDPEDMRSIIATYQRCCSTLIEENGGFVAKYMGDGILAYFGYPQAHEHDAERSVRAGVAIVEAIQQLETIAPEPLQVRIGIATGIVVVGDLLGSGESQERGVVGDTPNLAARLQSVAEPDSVVIADDTRKLLGDLFEYQDLGFPTLKGVSEHSRAWRILGQSAAESRFDALHTGGLSELVGREQEIKFLVGRWEDAKAGCGQIVILSGEAGIGKSRVIAAFTEQLAGETHTSVRYFCSPEHTDSPLSPVIRQACRWAGLAASDSASVKLDKLEAAIAAIGSPDDTELIADLLSVPSDGRYSRTDFSPQVRRERTMDFLLSQLMGMAEKRPLLVVFEDAHWADPSSLELIALLVERIPSSRAMLLMTARPEFEASWSGRRNTSSATICRLTPSQAAELIDVVAEGQPLAFNTRQDIVERADGIPLFIEEMTKAVIEAGDQLAAETIESIPSPALAVPASLHAPLMARLDRLGDAKVVAQVGAAIGREFSRSLLSAVTPLSASALAEALDRLVQAGLLTKHGVRPNETYIFKHALVQDAAYGTLLREPRHSLHARIAGIVEAQSPHIASDQPELLARHYAEAGMGERAARLWCDAGHRSLSRSANIEAEAQFKRSLAHMGNLTALQRHDRIRAQIGLANALMYTRGYTSAETKSAFEEAKRLVDETQALEEDTEDKYVIFSVLFGLWAARFVSFQFDAVRDIAQQSMELAESYNSVVPLIVGHSLTGAYLIVGGEFRTGCDHLDKALDLYEPEEHATFFATRFGMDFGSFLSFRAMARWAMGRFDAAAKDVDNALLIARQLDHAPTLMVVLHLTGTTQLWNGEGDKAGSQAAELMDLAREKRAPFYEARAKADIAMASSVKGDLSKIATLAETAIRESRALGSTIEIPSVLCLKAKTHAGLGQVEAARQSINEAITLVESSGEKWWKSEIQRVAGEVEWMSGDGSSELAKKLIGDAIDTARRQDAPSFELRAALSLSRIYREEGLPANARDALDPVLSKFEDDVETADLNDARRLLREVKAQSTPTDWI
ncbi:AAA family ATPase [Rhizobium leguminosarum]|uniref:AAA family ATPase n=1 Tax=Rhizobium leguminosarum TaxID=384 RepID=UPI00140F5F79|nr:adenylate/guanylate cyclase domain-containing protein [Rhizobium leguminosarum]QIO64011.1 AAA family ATPase [Rhizobium leguminosarum bv. trifolii]